MPRIIPKKAKTYFSIFTTITMAVIALLVGNVLIKKAIEVRNSKASSDERRYLEQVFSSFKVTHDIKFGQALNESGQMQGLYLSLYEPSEDTETMRPAIVWIHGGSFIRGSPVKGYVEDFAKRGYVSVAISYRLCSSIEARNEQLKDYPNNPSTLPPFLLNAQHDALAAVRWLRANAQQYGVDPNKIIVGGSSAGAIVAHYAGANYKDAGNSGNPGYSSKTSAVISVMGAMYFPEIWVNASTPPTVFLIGDQGAFYQYALDTKTVLEKFSIPAVMNVFPGLGHVLKPGRTLNPLIAKFLYDFVILETPPISAPEPSTIPLPTSPSPHEQAPDLQPTTKPLPTPMPDDQRDIDRACFLAKRYTDIENYAGTEAENQKLQRAIYYATKTGLNILGISTVDQALDFYNSYCN